MKEKIIKLESVGAVLAIQKRYVAGFVKPMVNGEPDADINWQNVNDIDSAEWWQRLSHEDRLAVEPALSDKVKAKVRSMTTPTSTLTVDLGDYCTHCGIDTSFAAGNGMFVNRIISDADAKLELQKSDELAFQHTVTVQGYQCPDCQAVECDWCGNQTIEYSWADHDTAMICEWCVERAKNPCPDCVKEKVDGPPCEYPDHEGDWIDPAPYHYTKEGE